jgi:transcriptional regulator NrdR family protein
VIESRTLANGESIRRRRECNGCGYRFTSYERIEEKQFMVVKRDGRREPSTAKRSNAEFRGPWKSVPFPR